MKQKKDSKKEKLILLIIILILLTVVTFLLIKCLGKIDNNVKIPTGNVDIFDIVMGDTTVNNNHYYYCDCNTNNVDKMNANNNIITDSTTGVICPNCGNIIEEVRSEIVVEDSEKTFTTSTPLKIFENKSYYVVDELIAPESENSYQFIIRNDNHFNIEYDLNVKEENIHNINMKYRLKVNGEYILGNANEYVTVNQLNQYDIKLADGAYNVYTLDWKWFESDNDTEIGTNVESEYRLNLEILAVQH